MQDIHTYLMKAGFPYHSVSIIHRHQELGLHCFFSNDVREKITNEVRQYIKDRNAGYSINEN